MTAAGTSPRPTPGAPRPYRFPGFERRRLPNGLTLLLAAVHKLPIITVNAVVHSGASRDPEGKEGLASITAALITEGAGTLDGAALTERFERLGTGLDAGADWDATSLQLTVTPDRMRQALALLADVLTKPALPERELDRLREERCAELMQLRAEPRGLADEAFSRAIYAQGARYALPEGGSEHSVRAIALADAIAWHADHFRPANTTLVVVGDITADEGERFINETLGEWKGAASPPNRRLDPVDTAAETPSRLSVIARDGAAQTEMRVGHVGLPRMHPDYFAAAVMNAILGGLFSSRINLNLREKHGYTYGAFSAFDWRLASGPFVVSSAVQSESTAEAVREVLGEIERIRHADVTDEELSLAISFLQGVFPIRYETTAAIAGALANLAIYGLPENYFDDYRDRIGALRPADLRRAAQQHLRPEALRIVVVGERAVVEGPLAMLGYGAPTLVDADGKFISNTLSPNKEVAR